MSLGDIKIVLNRSMIVYRIINIKNQKSYIGFTSKTLDKRWKEHAYAALKRRSHYRLHAAIRKYGLENFEQTVLAEIDDGDYALNVLEPLYIAEYNTIQKGYNTKPGGAERWQHTKETRYKMSLHNRWRGKSRSGELNPMYGKHHTEIVKQAQSERRKGKPSYTKKFVVWFPDGTKQYVDNLAAFCREHGLNKDSMSLVASCKQRTHKGFVCKHDTRTRILNRSDHASKFQHNAVQ